MPLADQATKQAKTAGQERAVVRLVSNGVKSQRDEWVYGRSRESVVAKAKFLVEQYEHSRKTGARSDSIKWDRELERYRETGISKVFDPACIVEAAYRPFSTRWFYFDRHFNGMTYQIPAMFPPGQPNHAITISDIGWRSEFLVLATDGPFDLHFGAAVDAYQGVSRCRIATIDSAFRLSAFPLIGAR